MDMIIRSSRLHYKENMTSMNCIIPVLIDVGKFFNLEYDFYLGKILNACWSNL